MGAGCKIEGAPDIDDAPAGGIESDVLGIALRAQGESDGQAGSLVGGDEFIQRKCGKDISIMDEQRLVTDP